MKESEMPAKLRIAFVILTWNSAACITACLDSLWKMQGIDREICVVDNGSADETVSILRDFEKQQQPDCRLTLVLFAENKGTTKSRNAGIRMVQQKAEYLCILDSDTQVTGQVFYQLCSLLGENPDNGIVGPRLRSADGTLQQSGRNIPTVKEKLCKVLPLKSLQKKGLVLEKAAKEEKSLVYPVGYLMSACWLMRMELVEKIGFLDEAIFYAPEDVEYCIRAWKYGYRVLYDSRVEIRHDWQRLSRRRLFSRHNWEHLKGLGYLFYKYQFFFSNEKINRWIY